MKNPKVARDTNVKITRKKILKVHKILTTIEC